MPENIPGSVTKSEMAEAFDISLKTFSSWLKTLFPDKKTTVQKTTTLAPIISLLY